MAYTKRYEDSYLDEEQDEIDDLTKAAETLTASGQNEKAIETWAKLVEIAENTGNKELYYMATERMSNIG